MSHSANARAIGMQLRHLGICVEDLPRMERFYTEVLGFTVTDRGHELNMDLVFLSRDPQDHHQIVLSTGRPKGLPMNAANPMFGPVINQISFHLPDLAELKRLDAHLQAAYPEGERMYANHGNAWSIYTPDPEGNLAEFYADTPWFCHQPMMQPLDLTAPEAEILSATEAVARSGAGFMPAEAWRKEIAAAMARS
jgi:catechol-2,3-dioxygenase